MEEIWQVEMFINVGTYEKPIMKWITDRRIYREGKTENDFDLCDVPNLRKDAKKIK